MCESSQKNKNPQQNISLVDPSTMCDDHIPRCITCKTTNPHTVRWARKECKFKESAVLKTLCTLRMCHIEDVPTWCACAKQPTNTSKVHNYHGHGICRTGVYMYCVSCTLHTWCAWVEMPRTTSTNVQNPHNTNMYRHPLQVLWIVQQSCAGFRGYALSIRVAPVVVSALPPVTTSRSDQCLSTCPSSLWP